MTLLDWQQLAPRQRKVLELYGLGHTRNEIAAELKISAKTVDTHRQNGMKQLGLANNVLLARFLLRYGLVTP